MKKMTKMIAVCAAVLCASLFLMTGCGDQDNFADYMQDQSALRSSIDAELAILSEDAKASVQYEENTAYITVDYFALTQKELEGEETEKCTERCNTIMQEALDQYHKDTGNVAQVEVTLYGHDAEKQ